MVELVDTPDLGSGGESRGGSSPFTRTKRKNSSQRFIYVNTVVGVSLKYKFDARVLLACW